MKAIFYFRSLLAGLLCLLFSDQLQARVYDVPHSVNWIRQVNAMPPGTGSIVYNSLQVNALPGDTFALLGGTRSPIRIDDLIGDSLNPILICNKNSQVLITNPSNGYYGLNFLRCRYIRVSGRTNPLISFGIRITQLPSGNGISINDFSSNFELEGLEIDHIYSSGISVKTDPTCANLNSYLNFTMYDVNIHHNYIHQVGNEGMYIGNTFYNDGSGWRINCSNPSLSLVVFPHAIRGVKVYQNFLDSSGWDAIQIASCFDASVNDNYIINDSYKDENNQTAGILVGQPSEARVFNNTIISSMGSAIQSFGVGTQIYNNLILYPGKSIRCRGTFNSSGQLVNSQFTYGLYISDKVCKDITVPKTPYLVAHNTIIIDKVYRVGSPYITWAPQGINANSLAYINGSFFGNNLVVIDSNFNMPAVNTVNGIFASNSVPNYSVLNNPSFISLNSRSTFSSNFYSNEHSLLQFNNAPQQDYTLKSISPAFDAALGSTITSYPYLSTDKLNLTRPQGASPDFGAFERFVTPVQINQIGMVAVPNPVSLNMNVTFEVQVDDITIQSPTLQLIGLTQQIPLSISSSSIQNNKLILTVQVTQLPAQTGLWSLTLSDGGVTKASTLMMIMP